MNRKSLIRTCLAGALAAGLTLTSVSAAMAAPAGKSPTRGTGVYVKHNDNVIRLGSSIRLTPITTMGPFSAGAYVVSFSTRVNTGAVVGPSADLQCFVYADHGRVNPPQSMFRYPPRLYLQATYTWPITTSAPGSIAVKCSASSGGNPIPDQVEVDQSQLIVQRVSVVHNR